MSGSAWPGQPVQQWPGKPANSAPSEPEAIAEGDWGGVGSRVAAAEAAFMGPVRDEERAVIRQEEARRQGILYGKQRGTASATGVRQLANTFSLGLPNLLEAATSGGDSGLGFAERHEFIKGADDGRSISSPWASAAGTVGGIVGQAVAVPTSLPTTIGQAARQGAVLGGATAGGEGLITSRGDLAEAATSGGVGAVAGALGGAAVQKVAPYVGQVADEAGRWIGDKWAFATSSPAQNASRMVGQAFEGVDPAAAARIVSQPDAVILDAGEQAARDLFRGATNISPRALEDGSRFLNERAAREVSSLSDEVTRTLGGANSVAQSRQGIADAARANTNALYQRAYAEAPDVFDEGLGGFVASPVGQATVRDAMDRVNRDYAARSLRGERLVKPELPFVSDELGNLSLKEGQTVGLEFWDAAKKSLDGQIGRAKNSGDRELVKELSGIKQALVSRLDDASGTYAAARGAAAEAFGAQDAVELGAKAVREMNVDGRDLSAAIKQLTPEQRLQYAQGAGADLTRQMAANERVAVDGGTRSVVNNVFTPERLRRAQEAATSPSDAQQLVQAVETWRRFADSRRALGNSTTARQEMTKNAITAGIGTAPAVYSAGANGGVPDPTVAVLGAALAGGRLASQAKARAISEEIAKIMLSRGSVPSAVPGIVSGLAPETREAITRALIMGSALTASQAAPR